MRSRLPDDHYCYIVCHVQNREDILSLRLTSRALGYEATKVLYRTLEINTFNKSVQPFLSYLSSHPRIASYVERFSITFPQMYFYGAWGGPTLIREFLCKAHNLKELCILTTGNGLISMTLGKLAEGAKFSLRHLGCNLPATESCTRFLQSQPGIVDLCWFSESVPKVTLSHLPNLTTLEIGTNDELLMALVPGPRCKIVRLKYGRLKAPLRGVFKSIEVLTVDGPMKTGRKLSQLFPNLRYLAARCHQLANILEIIQELFKLQKLVIEITGVDPDDTKIMVAELYSTQHALRYIDVHDDGYYFQFERGADNTPGQMLSSMRYPDLDEWKSWW